MWHDAVGLKGTLNSLQNDSPPAGSIEQSESEDDFRAGIGSTPQYWTWVTHYILFISGANTTQLSRPESSESVRR